MDMADGLETAGCSSPNRVPAPQSRNVTSRTPLNFRVRVAFPGRRRISGPSFSLDSLRAKTSLCQWPRAFEGRPLWGKAVYTASHGACLSSVPSGDRSVNPASVPGCSGLQRVLLSV